MTPSDPAAPSNPNTTAQPSPESAETRSKRRFDFDPEDLKFCGRGPVGEIYDALEAWRPGVTKAIEDLAAVILKRRR